MHYLKIKRCFDLVFSVLLLVITFPLLIFIVFALYASGEKRPLFVQKRIGLHAKIFKLYKFKTMKSLPVIDTTQFYVRKNDHRVTRFGRVLRITSLDELPQLVNIIHGDMSLVGPRPSIEGHPYTSKNYPLSLMPRLSVPPGLSGLAQVSGRNSLSNEQKYVIDCSYATKISFMTDLIVLFKTLLVLFNFNQVFDK